MDFVANACRQMLEASGMTLNPLIPCLANEQWSVWSNDTKLLCPTYNVLYEYLSLPSICTYWTTSHSLQPNPCLTDITFDLIDWQAVASFMQRLPSSRRRWCTKQASEQCGVGITLQQWNLQSDNCCPQCQTPKNCHHVLICPACGADETWSCNLLKLQETLTSLDTPPLLLGAIILRLSEWHQGSKFSSPSYWMQDLWELILSQDAIGWKNLLEGLPSHLWSPYIKSHYLASGAKKTHTRWLQLFLLKLHELAWGQREHQNQILQQTDTPHQARAIAHLDTTIAQAFHTGQTNMTPAIRHFFISPLGSLIFQSVSFKQAWYLNFMTVKQHQARSDTNAGILLPSLTLPDERLLHWIKTGYYN